MSRQVSQKLWNLLHTVLALTTVCVLATAAASAEGAKENVLPYVTNWVGNTFEGAGPNGQGRWVQDYIDEIEVTPDGAVITASLWDEAGRCTGIYKDGDVNTDLSRRQRRYLIGMPLEDNLFPKEFDVAGDYIFAVMVRSSNARGGVVHVWRTDTGDQVGVMFAGQEVGGNCGWVDMVHGVRAYHAASGDYLVVVEEDWRGKNLVYVWRPQNASAEVGPKAPKAQDIQKSH